VVVHNLSAEPREVSLDVGAGDARCLVNLLSRENSDADAAGKYRLLLEPYGYRWFRVGGLDYILKRSAI
jgi:maltose alpha-D-glucosyltransferase/alpha-amylase